MALSRAAKDYRNRKQRERYANDPVYRKRKRAQVDAYYERKAAEAAALEDQAQQDADKDKSPAANCQSK